MVYNNELIPLALTLFVLLCRDYFCNLLLRSICKMIIFQLLIDPEWDRFCQFIVHRINGNRIIFSLEIVIIRTTNAVKSPFRSRFLETMYYTTLYYDIIWTAKHRRHIIVIIVKPNFKPFSAVRLANACAGVCCTRVLWKVSACQMR